MFDDSSSTRTSQLPKVLEEGETDRLLDQPNQRYFSPHRDYLFMRVMLQSGLRVSEATSLCPEHIDSASGRTVVREGKGAKDRTVWLSEGVLSEIQEWMERRSACVETLKAETPLLPTRRGTEVDTSHLRRSVKRYARRAEVSEVERVSPHTLRHTFATRLYRKTGDIRMVQKALGHADVSTTMIYTHIADDDLSGAMRDL